MIFISKHDENIIYKLWDINSGEIDERADKSDSIINHLPRTFS